MTRHLIETAVVAAAAVLVSYEPVFDYSAMWEFVWQEVSFPIAHDED